MVKITLSAVRKTVKIMVPEIEKSYTKVAENY